MPKRAGELFLNVISILAVSYAMCIHDDGDNKILLYAYLDRYNTITYGLCIHAVATV